MNRKLLKPSSFPFLRGFGALTRLCSNERDYAVTSEKCVVDSVEFCRGHCFALLHDNTSLILFDSVPRQYHLSKRSVEDYFVSKILDRNELNDVENKIEKNDKENLKRILKFDHERKIKKVLFSTDKFNKQLKLIVVDCLGLIWVWQWQNEEYSWKEIVSGICLRKMKNDYNNNNNNNDNNNNNNDGLTDSEISSLCLVERQKDDDDDLLLWIEKKHGVDADGDESTTEFVMYSRRVEWFEERRRKSVSSSSNNVDNTTVINATKDNTADNSVANEQNVVETSDTNRNVSSMSARNISAAFAGFGAKDKASSLMGKMRVGVTRLRDVGRRGDSDAFDDQIQTAETLVIELDRPDDNDDDNDVNNDDSNLNNIDQSSTTKQRTLFDGEARVEWSFSAIDHKQNQLQIDLLSAQRDKGAWVIQSSLFGKEKTVLFWSRVASTMFDSGISVVNSKLALHPHTNELVCFSSNVLSAVLIVDARIKAAMHRRTHTFDLQPNSGCLRRVPLCHVSTSLDANSPHVQLLAHIHAYTLVDTSSGQYETFDVGGKQCSSALLDTAITSISHGTSISPAIVLCSQGLVALQSTLPAKPVSAMLDNNANDDVDCDRLLKIANSFQTWRMNNETAQYLLKVLQTSSATSSQRLTAAVRLSKHLSSPGLVVALLSNTPAARPLILTLIAEYLEELNQFDKLSDNEKRWAAANLFNKTTPLSRQLNPLLKEYILSLLREETILFDESIIKLRTNDAVLNAIHENTDAIAAQQSNTIDQQQTVTMATESKALLVSNSLSATENDWNSILLQLNIHELELNQEHVYKITSLDDDKFSYFVRVGYQINPIELSKILIEIDCKLVENFDRKRLWSRAYDALPLFEKHSNEKKSNKNQLELFALISVNALGAPLAVASILSQSIDVAINIVEKIANQSKNDEKLNQEHCRSFAVLVSYLASHNHIDALKRCFEDEIIPKNYSIDQLLTNLQIQSSSDEDSRIMIDVVRETLAKYIDAEEDVQL